MHKLLRGYWPILLIMLLGGVFRFTNLNWDMGGRIQPDEALIVNGALTIKFFSNLFPGFHDYNGFSIYLLKIASLIASTVLRSSYWSTTPEGVTLVGRFVSALLAMLSIPLMYLLSKRLWNNMVGILAGLLFACTPILIQLAHFYTTEGILIFLLLILLLGAIRYRKTPNTYSLIGMAIPAGLLLATKNTSYLFLPIPFSIILLNKSRRVFLSLVGLGLLTGFSFAIASPYSFLDLAGYLTRSKYLSDVVIGKLLMDWTLQFQETTPLFWPPNLLYAFGPVVCGIIGSLGLLLDPKTWKKNFLVSVFAVWMLAYLVFIGVMYLKFTRYSAPLAPFLVLFTAKLLWDISKRPIGKFIAFGLVATQLLWAVMFLHIYLVPNPSLRAAEWIATHVPEHAVLLTEEWNSIIRFERPPLAGKQYAFLSFNAYAPESDAKIASLITTLKQSQYIVIESPKVRNTILRLRDRYPQTSALYENLDHKELGFTKVAEFSSYPQLGPLVVNDEAAEETWTVFDHPTVAIYGRKGICSPLVALCQ